MLQGQGFKDIHVDGDLITWNVPNGQRYSVHIDLVDELTPVVMKGYAAVPKRGAEVGGLLLGSVLPDRTTIISAFIPCDVEYAYGPSFQLSNRDRKHLEGKLVAMRAAGKTVVGLYRSNTRPNFALQTSDVELFQSLFDDPATAFLLIQPSMSNITYAAILSSQQISQNELTPTNEFPFQRKALGFPPRETRPAPIPDTPTEDRPALPVNPPPITYAQPQAPTRPQPRFAPILVYAFTGLVGLGLGGVIGYQQGLKNGLQQDFSVVYRFPVSAQRQDGKTIVSWTPSSPAIRSANLAILYIETAGQTKTIVLNRDQLLAGQAIYEGQADDLHGRLELRFPGGELLSSDFTSR